MAVQAQTRKSRRHNGRKSRADTWMDAVEAVAAQGKPENDAQLEAAITEVRHRNKELARRQSELKG